MLEQETLLSQRYRIRGVLGQGGMGAVYLAEAVALGGKKVAVKEMIPWGLPPGELDQAVAQFKKEAAFLAGLEHPNVVRVADFFVEDGKHYLVMDYIQGETLQEKMVGRGRPFHWYELCGWVESLMDVLEYLHNQRPPIIFRDLKPSNIMISADGRLNLIDFGIARSACQGEKTTTFLRGTGTRGFSPIEQYGNQQSTDQRSDIYALGATLYYLLTATLPPDAVERVSRRATVVPLSERCQDAPGELDSIVDKAMALAAEDRYQTISELRTALRPQPRPLPRKSALEPPVVGNIPTVVVRSTRREKSSWQGWISAAGCLVLTGALLVSFSVHSQAADLKSVAHEIDVGNSSNSLEPTFNAPSKVQEDSPVSPTLHSPRMPVGTSEQQSEEIKETAAVVDPSIQNVVPKRSVRATLSLDSYPKARVSPVLPSIGSNGEAVLVEESIEAAVSVPDDRPRTVQEEEPTAPTEPEQTGPSEPVVQAPIYVMPPENSETAIQGGSSIYQTSTQWASRGQTVDPTQAAPPGGPSLTNVPVAASSPPGLANNEPVDVALNAAPLEASKRDGGKGKTGSKDSKTGQSQSKSQAKKTGSDTVAVNTNPDAGGRQKSGSEPKVGGSKGGAKGAARNHSPSPKQKSGTR